MMGTYFLVAALLFSITSNANSDLKPCNVKRTGKAPLFAKDCSDLGDGNYLVTPCSSNMNSCKTKKENVVGSSGCESASPSTPTPKESIAKLIEKMAQKYNAGIIDLSKGNLATPRKVENEHFYFAMVGSESFKTKEFARSFTVAGGKTNVSPRYVSGEEFGKATLGWQAFKVERNELKPIPLSAVVPECDTSTNKQPSVPTSNKDGE